MKQPVVRRSDRNAPKNSIWQLFFYYWLTVKLMSPSNSEWLWAERALQLPLIWRLLIWSVSNWCSALDGSPCRWRLFSHRTCSQNADWQALMLLLMRPNEASWAALMDMGAKKYGWRKREVMATRGVTEINLKVHVFQVEGTERIKAKVTESNNR